jgi:class 3 adenylate cyclase
VPGLPSGTVTLLFTDIEGSTRLLHELGDRYGGALADHRRLLRECFRERDGREAPSSR